MKRVIIIKSRAILGVVITTLLMLCGCMKEDMSNCSRETAVSVVAVDEQGEEIDDSNTVKGVLMYVFDHNKLFIRTLNTSIRQIEQIYFPDQDTIHIVSWGNLTDERQQMPDLAVGTPMHEAMVQLKIVPDKTVDGTTQLQAASPQATSQIPSKSQTPAIAESPDDLFYAYNKISLKSDTQSEYTLYMSRASAAMTITMLHLQGFTNFYDENYSIVVRETYSAIDFYGRLIGDKVGYIPSISFNDKKELIAPIFNLLPSHAEGVLEIDIYHDGELVTTVKNDSNKQPIRALRGKVLNLLVNFHITIEVSVEMTPWGTEYLWKDFSIGS